MFRRPSAAMKFDRPRISSVLSLSLALASPAVALAQQPQGLDQQRYNQANPLFVQQKYAEAAKVYESIQKDFPTSGYIPLANLQLGLSYFFLGEYDQGIAALRKNIAAKNVPAEVLEDSMALIPQILLAKAQKLPPDDPARRSSLDAALADFDTFIQRFPQSLEVEQANLGKARVYYFQEKYEEAAAALRQNVQRFPTSESALDTQYMLALVLATQANVTMKKATAEGEAQAATAAYDEAEKLLRDIINKRQDLALMNDAQFQLGEILAARGNYAEKGDVQNGILLKALEAYRGTYPKETVIEAQNARIAFYQQRVRDAGTKGNVADLRRAQSMVQRESAKLEDVKARPDQTLAAKLKSGQIYLTLHKEPNQPRMDEARVLFRFVDSFTDDPEQKKQILAFITLTYAAQHLAEKAEASYKQWSEKYEKDPLGENLALMMGAIYLDQDPKLNDPQKAIEWFRKQAELYPKSRFTGEAVMQEGVALLQQKQYDAAIKRITEFLATNPEKESAAAAEFALATIYKDTGKADEAIQTFRAVKEKYAGTGHAEQAAFWAGQMLAGKDAKAGLAELKAFTQTFASSELVPQALLSIAQTQTNLKQRDAAIATYQELATKFPKSELAPFALLPARRDLSGGAELQGSEGGDE